MKGKFYGIGSTVVIALALLLVLLWGTLQPADAQSGISNFTTVAASRDVYVGNDVLVDGFVTVNPAATEVLTVDGYLTPTATLHPISAAASIGLSGTHIAVQDAGTLLILLNVGSETITFTETGTLVSAGNIALGANDSATLISDGDSWYQIGASNN